MTKHTFFLSEFPPAQRDDFITSGTVWAKSKSVLAPIHTPSFPLYHCYELQATGNLAKRTSSGLLRLFFQKGKKDHLKKYAWLLWDYHLSRKYLLFTTLEYINKLCSIPASLCFISFAFFKLRLSFKVISLYATLYVPPEPHLMMNWKTSLWVANVFFPSGGYCETAAKPNGYLIWGCPRPSSKPPPGLRPVTFR